MNQDYFYKNYVKPYLKHGDRPFNRQLYNDAKDQVHREGLITDRQVQNWVYPYNNFFLAKNERVTGRDAVQLLNSVARKRRGGRW